MAFVSEKEEDFYEANRGGICRFRKEIACCTFAEASSSQKRTLLDALCRGYWIPSQICEVAPQSCRGGAADP
jgi:hypothetical protein